MVLLGNTLRHFVFWYGQITGERPNKLLVGESKIPPCPALIVQELAADLSIEAWDLGGPPPPQFEPPDIGWDGQTATRRVLPAMRSQTPPEPKGDTDTIGTSERYYCTGGCGRSWEWNEVPHWSRQKKRKPWCNECGADAQGWWNAKDTANQTAT